MNPCIRVTAVFSALIACSVALLMHLFPDNSYPQPRHQEVYRAIQDQLKAFREADFQRAYYHGAQEFRKRLTPVQFEHYARRHFSTLAQAQQIEFGTVRFHGPQATVEVFFLHHGGVTIPCLYTLSFEEGVWKVKGVEVMEAWPPGYRLSGRQA